MSRGPPNTQGMTSLKVDNLPYRTTPDDLRKTFEKYGEVGDVYIPRDKFTFDSRGFAFVRYYDKMDAEDAIDGLDGEYLDGRELRVQMAKYGRPSSDSRRPAQRSRYGGDSQRRGRYGRSYSRSRSRSPERRRRRSPSRSRSRSPTRHRNERASPSKSRSRSPGRNVPKSPSRSRSRSKS